MVELTVIGLSLWAIAGGILFAGSCLMKPHKEWPFSLVLFCGPAVWLLYFLIWANT